MATHSPEILVQCPTCHGVGIDTNSWAICQTCGGLQKIAREASRAVLNVGSSTETNTEADVPQDPRP